MFHKWFFGQSAAIYSTPPEFHYQQPPPAQQSYQYQPQYNYNQPVMAPGASHYQHSYQLPPQQTYPHVDQHTFNQPQQVFQQTFQGTSGEGETWNISPNKASYVVSICGWVLAIVGCASCPSLTNIVRSIVCNSPRNLTANSCSIN